MDLSVVVCHDKLAALYPIRSIDSDKRHTPDSEGIHTIIQPVLIIRALLNDNAIQILEQNYLTKKFEKFLT